MRRMNYPHLMITACAVLALTSGPARAHSFDADFGEFDGESCMVFPPSDPLILLGGASLEFWVQPDWLSPREDNPVIISNSGPVGALYEIAIAPLRDGLVIHAGAKEEIVGFDFTDGTMHHVAVISFEDSMIISIDGIPRLESLMSFANLPSGAFSIGCAPDGKRRFLGAIGNLRVWDTTLAPEDILNFAQTDVDGETPHPELEDLVGRSDFASNTFLIEDFDPETDELLVEDGVISQLPETDMDDTQETEQTP